MEDSEVIVSNGKSVPLEEETMENIQSLLQQKIATEKVLSTISEQGNVCNEMIKKLKEEFEENRLSTKDGMSFLEVKNHLLLQYLISISGITLLKTAGKSIQNSPYLHQSVEIRTFMEKMRPIESKLKYQIDKLVSNTIEGKTPTKDPLKYRANLDDLQDEEDNSDDEDMSDEDSETEKFKNDQSYNRTGVYRPPKVAPVHYDGDEGGVADASKKAESSRKKSINQALVRELQEEFLDTPVEIHNMGDAYAKQLSREVKDKQRFEETYMTRLPVTKRDKHRENAMSTLGVLGDEITDFRQKRPSQQGTGKGKKRKAGGKKSKGSRKKFRK